LKLHIWSVVIKQISYSVVYFPVRSSSSSTSYHLGYYEFVTTTFRRLFMGKM